MSSKHLAGRTAHLRMVRGTLGTAWYCGSQIWSMRPCPSPCWADQVITTTTGRTQLWMGPKMHKPPDVGLKDLIISNLIASWPIPKLSLLAHLWSKESQENLFLWPCHVQCTGLYGLADMFFILEPTPSHLGVLGRTSATSEKDAGWEIGFQEPETSSSRLSASLKAGSCSGNLPNTVPFYKTGVCSWSIPCEQHGNVATVFFSFFF